jgi:hypothetical protein
MKKKLEKKLRLAFKAGSEYGAFLQAGNYFDKPLDEDEFIESLKKSEKITEEEKIPLTFAYLKSKLDWSDICDVTGLDYYCLNNGYEIKSYEVFNIDKIIAKQYNLI